MSRLKMMTELANLGILEYIVALASNCIISPPTPANLDMAVDGIEIDERYCEIASERLRQLALDSSQKDLTNACLSKL